MSSLIRLIRFTFGAGLVLAALSGIALAQVPNVGPTAVRSPDVGPTAVRSPEIDAGTALSAMTLLSGGILMLTDRRRKK